MIDLIWFITTLCIAELAIQVAYASTLAESLKVWLLLSDTQNRKWRWGWQKVRELANCPYCLGFHLGWITNLCYWHMSFGQALLFAPLVLIMVDVIRKLSK
jgi:hypothetical protein